MNDEADDVARTLGLGDHAKGSSRRWIWMGAIAAAVVVSGYWFLGSAAEPQAQYETVAASRADLTITVSATGTVEPTNLVEISSELSGMLVDVNVDFNDMVEDGTVLASLDTTTLEAELAVSKASLDAAIARIAMAKASLYDARAQYMTAQELDMRGVTAHQTLVTRKASFDRAAAELLSAEADRSLAAAQLDLKKAVLEKACICSPIQGVVLDRAVDPGQIVAASLSAPVLFTLAEDLTKMELQVDIDEADISRVHVGDPAEFTVDAHDERRFPAEIAEIRFSPETVDGVVTYKAVLSIDNSEMLLRPGMTAAAEITVDFIEDALVVPNAALRYSPPVEVEDGERSGLLGMLIPDAPPQQQVTDSRSIWVLRDGVPVQVLVRTGSSDGDNTEIISGDLDVEDAVITDQFDG